MPSSLCDVSRVQNRRVWTYEIMRVVGSTFLFFLVRFTCCPFDFASASCSAFFANRALSASSALRNTSAERGFPKLDNGARSYPASSSS